MHQPVEGARGELVHRQRGARGVGGGRQQLGEREAAQLEPARLAAERGELEPRLHLLVRLQRHRAHLDGRLPVAQVTAARLEPLPPALARAVTPLACELQVVGGGLGGGEGGAAAAAGRRGGRGDQQLAASVLDELLHLGEVLRAYERAVNARVRVDAVRSELRVQRAARRVDGCLGLVEAARVHRQHGAVEAALVGPGVEQRGERRHRTVVLAVPADGREHGRHLELLPRAQLRPHVLRHARELLPLRESGEAAHPAHRELATARALGVRRRVRAEAARRPAAVVVFEATALVHVECILPAAQLLEPRELHLQPVARARLLEHAERGLWLLQRVVQRHQRLDEPRRALRRGVRVELDLAVVQRLGEGLAARSDVAERARVHGELPVVPLHVLRQGEQRLQDLGRCRRRGEGRLQALHE